MAPPRPPLTGMNARWALLGSNKQLLPCKCWQAHRCYLNKRPVCLVSQCFQVPVSDGWFRLIFARLGSKWGLRYPARGPARENRRPLPCEDNRIAPNGHMGRDAGDRKGR